MTTELVKYETLSDADKASVQALLAAHVSAVFDDDHDADADEHTYHALWMKLHELRVLDNDCYGLLDQAHDEKEDCAAHGFYIYHTVSETSTDCLDCIVLE